MSEESTTPDLVERWQESAEERWGYTVTWAEGMIARVIVRPDIDEARAAAERLGQESWSAMSEENLHRLRVAYENLRDGRG